MLQQSAHADVIQVEAVGPRQILLLLVGVLVLFCDGFDVQMVSFIAPALSSDWQLPKGALAPIFAANLTGLMIGALTITPFADLFSRKTIIMVCVGIFGILTLLPPFATNLTELGLIRFATGLALGAAMPCMIAASSDYLPTHLRTRLMVLLSCAFSFGNAMCGVVAGLVVARYGWQAMFWLGGLLPILLIPLLYLFLPESPVYLLKHGRTAQLEKILREMESHMRVRSTGPLRAENKRSFPVLSLFRGGLAPTTLFIWITYFCSGATLYFLSNWLPTLVTDAHFSADQAAFSSSLYQFGGLAGGFLIGYLVDRIGILALALSMLSAAVAVIVTGVSVGSIVAIAIAAFVSGVFVIGSQNTINAYVGGRLYPTDIRATGLGWALGAVRLGGVLAGSLGAGFVISLNLPIAQTFIIIGAPEIIAALALLAIHRRGRQSGDATVGASAALEQP